MNIQVTGSVIILTNHQTVFDYISNLENDSFWRKEINATIMTSKPQIDALAIENAYWVAKHDMKKYLTKLKSVLENADNC
jgi:hypothetical protein